LVSFNHKTKRKEERGKLATLIERSSANTATSKHSTINTLHVTTTPAREAQPKASREMELSSSQQLRQREEGNNAGKATYKNACNKNIGDGVKITPLKKKRFHNETK
jgi:hypothetical protein